MTVINLSHLYPWTDSVTKCKISLLNVTDLVDGKIYESEILDCNKRIGMVIAKIDNKNILHMPVVEMTERQGEGIFTRFQNYALPQLSELGVKGLQMVASTKAALAFCKKNGWQEPYANPNPPIMRLYINK